jgi:HK97 family phage portal protein
MMQRLADAFRVLAFGRASPSRPQPSWYMSDPTIAGVPVTASSSQTLSAFWASVGVISETIATLPWQLFRREPGGTARLLDHPVERLIGFSPNEEMSAGTFVETLLGHCLVWGNAYAEIVRDGSGRPAGLWLLTPDRVNPHRLPDGTLVYRVASETGGEVLFAPRDILHVKGRGYDGITGYSVVHMAARSLGINLAIETYAARYFGNGGRKTGILQSEKPLDEGGMQYVRRSFQEQMAERGPNPAPMVLNAGMKWVDITIPPNEAQFLESRRFGVDEVARWFRVPPHMIGSLERATFSNIEHQGTEFVRHTLMPWIRRLEEEADRKLAVPSLGPSVFTRIDTAELQRGDSAARSALDESQLRTGQITINEARQRNGLDPVGPKGDRHLVQAQMVPIEQAGTRVSTPATPAQPEEPQP